MSKSKPKSCRRYGTKSQGKLIPKKKPAKEKWDYNKSVKDMRVFVRGWKKMTAEFLWKLFTIREFLKKYEKLGKTPSWADFCKEAGLSMKVVNGWLRACDPSELLKAGKHKSGKI